MGIKFLWFLIHENLYSCLAYCFKRNTVGRLCFKSYKFCEWCRKGSSWKLFLRMTFVVHAATLYNTHELACATRQATLKDTANG